MEKPGIAQDQPETKSALGMMSGTSMDGVDIALIRTDGLDHVARTPGQCLSFPYGDETRALLKAVLRQEDISSPAMRAACAAVTDEYIVALDRYFDATGLTPSDIDVIGAHGQTVTHRPEKRLTIQLGDPARLAAHAGLPVVFDLRRNDVAHGGQGAPLLPVYHRALVRGAGLALPVAVLNLGGVGNITWMGEGEADFIAFDTGPANAYLDDWMMRHTGRRMDENGAAAAAGRTDDAVVAGFLTHPYFAQRPPKSLDREDFAHILDRAAHLSLEDGAATLAECTAAAAARALAHLPRSPRAVFVCGGGSRNPHLMRRLAALMPECAVATLEDLGVDPDAVEAEGFAYMAVRAMAGAPISFPGTTGAPHPLTGGRIYAPSEYLASGRKTG